jgi:hypothetical protein
LIALIAALITIQVFPGVSETVYPVIDTLGGNMTNMATEQTTYHCGDKVVAFFQFQKQRNILGTIKWKLVPDKPDARAFNYPPRPAAAPVGIVSHWAGVEDIPPVCLSGKYHFEGTISYPVWFGQVSYPLRTSCFQVEEKK